MEFPAYLGRQADQKRERRKNAAEARCVDIKVMDVGEVVLSGCDA